MASITSLKASDGTGNASVATVQSVRSSGATTLVVDTVQGINTKFHATMGTPHTFVDPVTSETITVISEATAVDFKGHVDGGNLEIDTIAPGFTDAGSAVNDIVIIKPTTQWADNVASVLAVEHNDDGTLKNNAVVTANITDEAVTPAKTLYGVASYRMTSNTTYSSFTNQKLGLGTFLTDGTVVFTTSSNGIAIPSGVNYVEVSATISGVVTTTNNYYLRIYKDAVLQREAYARFSASTNSGVALTPFLLSVSSGEVIYLYLGADSSSTFRADIGTALTVKYVS